MTDVVPVACMFGFHYGMYVWIPFWAIIDLVPDMGHMLLDVVILVIVFWAYGLELYIDLDLA